MGVVLGDRYPRCFLVGGGGDCTSIKIPKNKNQNRGEGGGRGRGDEFLWKKNKFWYTGNEGFVEIYWRNTHAPISCLVIYFLFYCDSFCIDISHDSGSKLSIKYKNLRNLYVAFIIIIYDIFFSTSELQTFKTSTCMYCTHY